jgi:CRP/FNR family transcriptional regulator
VWERGAYLSRPAQSAGSLREVNASPVQVPDTAAILQEATAGEPEAAGSAAPGEIDPFYLFACRLEWETRGETSAAWDLIAAAQSSHAETRAHARALLASSPDLGGLPCRLWNGFSDCMRNSGVEGNMRAPYGLEVAESCAECNCRTSGFFCNFSREVREALDPVSQRSTLPAGAILFVEGQMPRGMFIICSGSVELSTASKEGKVLILKTAGPGETLGLSAAISGMRYEVTAETATPCQLNFVDRKSVLNLLEHHTEVGMHVSQCLSREFQFAYRDIHELVLSRSSAGRLARLLLSHTPANVPMSEEVRLRIPMTHQDMAQRIGSSRETVTRLLSDLRKKQLIRLDGATLVIQDRSALEAMAM